MGSIAISLLMAASLAAFVWLAQRKLAIVAHLQPEMRWDQPWQRLRSVLVNGFLQSRMVRREWKPGLMHATIFTGFVVLIVRKLQLIAIGYHEPFVYSGIAGGIFATLKDCVEIAVLVALGYAYWRRYARPQARLEPNREALLILSLITAIIVTDLMFDGFRFALFAASDPGIAHEQAFAFAGRALAAAFSGLPQSALTAGYHASYWVQLVVVFSFLVLLPTGEHFHIVTALPALYFRRGRPANQVPGVDLEKIMSDDAGEDVAVGITTTRDLTWKEGLDAFTCTECGRCKDACPTFLTGKPLSMKWVNDSIKHELIAHREALVGDAKAEVPALMPDIIKPETLWACTTCGYCEAACPIELEHLPRFYRLRQHQVMMEGAFPHELKAVFDAYEAQSNPWGLPGDARAEWARALEVPVVTDAAAVREIDYLFYVGSAESFDPRGQRVAKAFVQVMRAAGIRFGILGAMETSTGECVRRLGNEMLFQQLAETLVGTLNELGVTRIVTCDPHAFNTLRNEYPAFGGNYEVYHHTQVIAQWLAAGRLRVRADNANVILHDPCYLGRHNGEFDAPRAVLGALGSNPPREFPLNREKSMCCGAGGGRMWMEETIGRRINVTRAQQALDQQPACIATACPYCAIMLSDGVSALNANVPVRDIAELVAAALVDTHVAEAEAVAA